MQQYICTVCTFVSRCSISSTVIIIPRHSDQWGPAHSTKVPREDLEILRIPPLFKNFSFFANRSTPKKLQLLDKINTMFTAALGVYNANNSFPRSSSRRSSESKSREKDLTQNKSLNKERLDMSVYMRVATVRAKLREGATVYIIDYVDWGKSKGPFEKSSK